MIHTSNSGHLKRLVVGVVGLALMSLNVWGLTQTLQGPDLKAHAQPSVLLGLTREADETTADFVRRVNQSVYEGIWHYWDDAGIDRFHLRVPGWENPYLYLASFLAPKHFLKYEFSDPAKATERGVGLCSQHAIVAVEILQQSGVASGIYGLSGHTVAYANVGNETWVIDPDYGVVVPFDPDTVEGQPDLIRAYYAESGLPQDRIDKLIRIYGPEGNHTYPGVWQYKSWKFFVEIGTYTLKWLLPVIMIGFGLFGDAIRTRVGALVSRSRPVPMWVWLGLVIVVALCARLWHLDARGIYEYDEGWYLLESKSMYDAGVYLAGTAMGENLGGLKTYLKERGNVPITSFKPGHNVNILAAFLLFGVSDYAALLFSALLGTATVFVVYLLGRDLGGPNAGIVAAAVLAVSAFHIGYSRNAYAQADSTFFITLGTWLWLQARLKGRTDYLAWGGLAVGYAFTCHYNVALVPVLLIAAEVAVQAEATVPWRRFGRQFGLFCLAMALPLLVFELSGRAVRLAGLAPTEFHTYFEQFFVRRTDQSVAALQLSPWATSIIADRFITTEGVLCAALLPFGLWALLSGSRQRGLRWAVVALGLVPLTFWLGITKGVDIRYRVFLVAFPFLAVTAGCGYTWLSATISRWRLAPVVLSSLVVIGVADGLRRVQPFWEVRSGYKEAVGRLIAHVDEHGGEVGFCPGSAWPVWNFYLSSAYEKTSPETRSRIAFYAQKDDHQLVGDYEPIDRLRYLRALRRDTSLLGYFEAIRSSSRPVVRIVNRVDVLPDSYLEGGGPSYDRSFRTIRSRYPQASSIRIFDLRRAGQATFRRGDVPAS